nr:hypothetical protein NRS6120_03584 [Bacillus subtilis]
MKKADMAMYAAKERNKSKYRYYSFSIGNKESVKLNQEMVLREAIENDRFVLHYQCKKTKNDRSRSTDTPCDTRRATAYARRIHRCGKCSSKAASI